LGDISIDEAARHVCCRLRQSRRFRESRRLHPRNFLAAHLNINSYRYKFDEIKELLSDKIVDIFFVAKTEFISSFLFTPEVELGVFDVFSRVSSKSVLLFPQNVKKNCKV
jgi:hypothetical protein